MKFTKKKNPRGTNGFKSFSKLSKLNKEFIK